MTGAFRIVALAMWLSLMVLPLAGCMAYGGAVKAVNRSIASDNPQAGLKHLVKGDFPKRDVVLYHLERGTLLRLAGRYKQSNQEFEAAKARMDALYTQSLSKAAGTVLLNDAVDDYGGEHYEKVYVLVNEMLNYLAMHDPDDARVMAQQLDTRLDELGNEYADNNDEKVFSCAPYADYLSGVVYEELKEWDSARIVYERAYDCYKNNPLFGGSVPLALQRALLRITTRQGLDEEFQRYENEFKLDVPSGTKIAGQGKIVFILDAGFIAHKRENSVLVSAPANPAGIYTLKIALPYIDPHKHGVLGEVEVSVADKRIQASRMMDLDGVARATLRERMPVIMARAIARAMVKAKAQKEVQRTARQENNPLISLFATIGSIATEVADTRSWRSLPETVWVAPIPVEPGTYDLRVTLDGSNGASYGHKLFAHVKVAQGQTRVVYYRWALPPRDRH